MGSDRDGLRHEFFWKDTGTDTEIYTDYRMPHNPGRDTCELRSLSVARTLSPQSQRRPLNSESHDMLSHLNHVWHDPSMQSLVSQRIEGKITSKIEEEKSTHIK
jgi:hypothetical protein